MKKLLAILMTLAAIGLVISGCKKDETPATDTTGTTATAGAPAASATTTGTAPATTAGATATTG
jgi:hypothetical protein